MAGSKDGFCGGFKASLGLVGRLETCLESCPRLHGTRLNRTDLVGAADMDHPQMASHCQFSVGRPEEGTLVRRTPTNSTRGYRRGASVRLGGMRRDFRTTLSGPPGR